MVGVGFKADDECGNMDEDADLLIQMCILIRKIQI